MKITVVSDDKQFFTNIKSIIKLSGASFVLFDDTRPEESAADTSLMIVDLLAHNRNIPAGKYPIVVFSDVPSYAEAVRFLRMGVKGYGNRLMNAGNMNQLINTVLSGQIWLPPSILSRLIASVPSDSEQNKSSQSFKELSDREREVAELIGQGYSNKEIGERMNITLRTVKAHVSSVFMKTGCRDRLEVAIKVKSS
jgi:DNA-binding NarL/FixJ family response regulator